MCILFYRCLCNWSGTAGDKKHSGWFGLSAFIYAQRFCRENNEPKVLKAETVLTSLLRESATKTRI